MPRDIGLKGNEREDELAADEHELPPSFTVAQAAGDDARLLIQLHARARQPNPRLENGEAPPLMRAPRLPPKQRSGIFLAVFFCPRHIQ